MAKDREEITPESECEVCDSLAEDEECPACGAVGKPPAEPVPDEPDEESEDGHDDDIQEGRDSDLEAMEDGSFNNEQNGNASSDATTGAQPTEATVEGSETSDPIIKEFADQTEEDERFRNNMKKLGDQPAVGFMGFKTAGKTWLLHRMLQELDTYVDCHPPFQAIHPNSAGERLKATTDYEFHRILTENPFTLIDTPGENTQELTLGNVQNLWKFLAVLKRSSALIVALPADVLIFGARIDRPKRLKDDELTRIATEACGPSPDPAEVARMEAFIRELRADYHAVNEFTNGLFLAASALSYVKANNINCLEPESFAKVTTDAIVDHRTDKSKFRPVGGKTGLECPVFVALTKADRVASVLCADADFDEVDEAINYRKEEMLDWPQTKVLRALAKRGGLLDKGKYPLSHPADLIRALNEKLHHRMVTFFPMTKFDFVSAFFGHDYSDLLKYGHYEEFPAHGVEHIRDWIRRSRDLAKRGDSVASRPYLARKLHHIIHEIPIDSGIRI